MNENQRQAPLAATVIGGKCPRCGQGPLFKDYLAIRDKCEACGQSFAFADSGDGPAVLVILAAGALVVAVWALTNIFFQLTVLTQLAIFIPVIVIVSVGLMRPFKAALIALQYRNKAGGGHSD